MMLQKFFLKRFKHYLFVMLLPLLIVVFIAVLFISHVAEQSAQTNAEYTLSSIEENIDLVITNALYQHDLMSLNPQLALSLQKLLLYEQFSYSEYIFLKSARAILKSIAESHPYIDSIYLYLDDGTNFFHSGKGVQNLDEYNDISWLEHYKAMPAEKQLFVESRLVKRLSSQDAAELITIYQRMTNMQGVIIANIDKAKFNNILNSFATNPLETTYLINGSFHAIQSQGNFLADLDFRDVFTQNNALDNPFALNGEWLRINHHYYLFNITYKEDFDIYLISLTDSSYIQQVLRTYVFWFIALLLLLVCLIIWLSYSTTKRSFRQINYVIQMFDDAEKGIINKEMPHEINDEYDIILNNVLRLFLNTTFLNSQLNEQKYMREASELQALQLQINPHFLFNTLQTLNLDILNQTGKYSSSNKIIDALSDILHYSLEKPEQPVTLLEEVNALKKYVLIQSYRFGDRFTMYYEIDEELYSTPVLRLLLQPLIENSIAHGMQPSAEHCFIKLKVFQRENNVIFTVIDNGAGISASRLAEVKEMILKQGSRNIGLTNINQRLLLKYGEGSSLHIQSKEGFGTCITFKIPGSQ